MAMHIHAIQGGTPATTVEAPGALAYPAAVLAWLLSAGVYIAAKWANADMPPWALCFWRLAIACLILLPIVRHHYAVMAGLLRSRPLQLLLVAATGLTFCQGL